MRTIVATRHLSWQPTSASVQPAARADAGVRRHGRIVGALIALTALLAAAANAATLPTGFLTTAERGRAVAVGSITAITPIDRSANVATLVVERVLSGDLTPGAAQRVAWEELALGRPLRFAVGQHVLIVLEPLPPGSLWRQRFPAGDALAVGGTGVAYLVDPPAADVALLVDYLKLHDATPSARAAALVRLAADGSPALAVAALERLAAPDVALDGACAQRLVALASDAARPLAQRSAALHLLAEARVTTVAPQIEPLARAGSPLEADALAALGALGALPQDRVEALLDRSDPTVRAVGARFASGALAERRLPALVREDPAPAVRAAAARTLAGTRTIWGLDAALPALADSDPSVRSAAATAIGQLGDPAIPTLERVARDGGPQARGAIAALGLAGQSGTPALRRLASELSDPKLRDFARLALGQGPHPH